MTTTDKLRQHYDKFTAIERINLVLAAQERGDEAEAEALENRCSMAQGLEYERRLLCLRHATSVLVVQLLAREVLVGARLEKLANARQAAAHPALDDLDADASRADVADGSFGDDKLASLLERAAAIWFGFSACCRDVGHDPHQVLRLAPMLPSDRDPAFFVIHLQIEYLERLAQHLLHDLDEMEMWRHIFAQAFRSLDEPVGE